MRFVVSPLRRKAVSSSIVARVLCALLFVSCVNVTFVSPARAQNDLFDLLDEVEPLERSSTSESSSSDSTERRSTRRPSRQADDGGGIDGRFGHLAFETFGRDESITPLELLPYYMADEHMLFGDLRGFISNNALFGGNAGLGYRRWLDGWSRVLGASFWYDADDTTGNFYNQLGVSLETYGEIWDFRTNYYFPIGDKGSGSGITITNVQFNNNNLLFDARTSLNEAMQGFDMEFGVLPPISIAQEQNLRAYAGWYHFFGDAAETIDGLRLRLEGNISEQVSTQVEYTTDDTFGSNIMVGINVLFSGGGSGKQKFTGTSASVLMRRFVQRNYNVIVSRGIDIQNGILAINPDTGNAYNIQHVSSTAGGAGTGEADSPFDTIADAQAAGGDIYFVHEGSVLTAPVVLQDGERLWGEGVGHFVETQKYGRVQLPGSTDGSNLPVFQNITGNAITLASGADVSGFTIDGATGHGIVGTGVDSATISHMNISGTALDGISLQNSSGTFALSDISIEDTAGAAFHLDGGTANVNFSGTIENSSGRVVIIENLDSGTVNLADSTIEDDGGTGLLVRDTAATITFGDVSVLNSASTGIDVNNIDGTVNFAGETKIEDSTGTSISLADNTGTVSFADVEIDGTTGARGVEITDSTGTVTFNTLDIFTDGGTGFFASNTGAVQVIGGKIESDNAAAVDIEDAALNIGLTSVSSDGGAYGIRIVDTTGTFAVFGVNPAGSGGAITNAGTGVILENAGTVGLQLMDIDDNGIGISSVGTNILHLSAVRITDSDHYGIDSLNTKAFQMANAILENNGAVGDNSVRLRVDALGDYNYQFVQNSILDDAGSAIAIESSGAGNNSTLVMTVGKNAISTTHAGGAGVDIDWTGRVVGTVAQNSFLASGGSNIGVNIKANDSTAIANYTVLQNVFTFAGSNNTGVKMDLDAPAQVQVGVNNITFNGTGGIGAQFDIEESTSVNLTSNLITDNSGGATGILFNSVDGPANVAVNDNVIRLLGSGGLIDQGIIFANVTDDLNLSGTVNNVIQGATTSFFVPIGSADGKIVVNGSNTN